jgi:hypothetical protein
MATKVTKVTTATTYDEDTIYDKLLKTIEGLRYSVDMMLASGNFVQKQRYKLNDDELAAQLGATADMLHELVIDNVIVFGVLEKHAQVKADFEALRQPMTDKIIAELRARLAEKMKNMPQAPRIILPGAQARGRFRIAKK